MAGPFSVIIGFGALLGAAFLPEPKKKQPAWKRVQGSGYSSPPVHEALRQYVGPKKAAEYEILHQEYWLNAKLRKDYHPSRNWYLSDMWNMGRDETMEKYMIRILSLVGKDKWEGPYPGESDSSYFYRCGEEFREEQKKKAPSYDKYIRPDDEWLQP